MSLEERITYLIRCDNCGRTLGTWPGDLAPQDVLIEAMVKFGWTVEDERTHCADCPSACDCGEDEHCVVCGLR